MGGKCSAELANLYCYAVEAEFIDHLIENNRLDEAKKWFFTWRYIDDLCGFGDRGQNWDQPGMEWTMKTQPIPPTMSKQSPP